VALSIASGGGSIPLLAPESLLRFHSGLEVEGGEVHLWALSLDSGADTIKRCTSFLSSEERARATRFVYHEHRNEFILSHGMLRHLLGRYLGTAPEAISFDAGLGGKPVLSGHSHGLSFNLSHSRGRAVLAVSDGRDVGIDVELERPDVDMLSIASSYFCRSELDAIRSVALAQRCSEFFRYWVAKEAVLKGEGLGLGFPLDRLEVRFAVDRQSAQVVSFDTARLREDWTIRMLSLGRRWPVAVSALGQNWRASILGSQRSPSGALAQVLGE
jgi:4'-phosphopantetheinyl transferase